MKNIKQQTCINQNSAVAHKMFQVNIFIQILNIFIQILLCILTIYTWQLFIAEQPPCPTHDAFGSLLRFTSTEKSVFIYLHIKICFSFLLFIIPYSHTRIPASLQSPPTWSPLPVLKKTELHQILPYLSQKWGRMDLVAEKDTTITGAGKRRNQQCTEELLFQANPCTEVPQFLPESLVLCTGKQHTHVFVQHHVPDPLNSLNFTCGN